MSLLSPAELGRRYLEEIYVAKHVAQAAELLAPAAMYRGPLTFAEGAAAVMTWLTEWVTAFPDTAVAVQWTTADAERAIFRVTLRGTYQGDFRGVAPTGRRISLPAVFLFTAVEGRLTDVEVFYDTRHFAEQLGVDLPPAKHFAEK